MQRLTLRTGAPSPHPQQTGHAQSDWCQELHHHQHWPARSRGRRRAIVSVPSIMVVAGEDTAAEFVVVEVTAVQELAVAVGMN